MGKASEPEAPAHEMEALGNEIGIRAGEAIDRLRDLLQSASGTTFVGIHQKHPRRLDIYMVQGPLPAFWEIRRHKRNCTTSARHCGRDERRIVRAVRVQHHNTAGAPQALKASGSMFDASFRVATSTVTSTRSIVPIASTGHNARGIDRRRPELA